MVPTILVEEDFPRPTHRSGLVYRFTPKHHDGHDPDAARWLPELTRDEEFGVFELADDRAIADDDGNLYGLLRGVDGDLRDLGTWEQVIAEFPFARPGEPWHGYPVWPVNGSAPEHRRGQVCRPATEAFDRLFDAGLISRGEKKRLRSGKL
ncbi:MAG: hypothetical protein K2X87_17990 [Gemmataceae bacterium]|nr:hypothetical protein [Gemmataceae bacterium]